MSENLISKLRVISASSNNPEVQRTCDETIKYITLLEKWMRTSIVGGVGCFQEFKQHWGKVNGPVN